MLSDRDQPVSFLKGEDDGDFEELEPHLPAMDKEHDIVGYYLYREN
jgi:hypothetical protein